MLFPKSKRVVYENNPLEEVVCQLRFPPILEIKAKDPSEFQERIRAEYPLYEEGEVSQSIEELMSQMAIPRPETVHRFLTENSSRCIALSSGFVAYADKEYQQWEEFRKEIHRAIETLEDIYRPSFYIRIGLRYRDVIDRQKLRLEDSAWSELLAEALCGILGADKVAPQVRNARAETMIELDEVPNGQLLLRHGTVSPPKSTKQVYLLDADFFADGKIERDDVNGILDQFNRLSGRFFRWAITPKLRDALGPEDIL